MAEMVGPKKKLVRKRKYSRGGCDECKRRKMKCDEGKPFCYNCTRLKKKCNYSVKPRRGSQLSEVSSLADDNGLHSLSAVATAVMSETSPVPQPPESFSVKHYLPSGAYLNSFLDGPTPRPISSGGISIYENALKHTVRPSESDQRMEKFDQSPQTKSFTNAISDILTPTDSTDYVANQNNFLEVKHLFDEAALLVNDMDALQSYDILNFDRSHSITDNTISNPLVERKLKDLSTSSNGSISSDTFEKHNFHVNDFSEGLIGNANNGNYLREYDLNSPQVLNINHLDYNITSNSELIEEVIKQHHLVGPHAAYLRYLNSEETSYGLFPFASSVENNEVSNLLLKYSNNCPYLLSSLLAMIATVEFNSTGKKVHEISGQKYVSVCLKSLSQAFATNSSNRVNQFLNDIERLLLTVILLTSIFSSKAYKDNGNILNSWKTHLRGAKDLLINYNLTTKNQNRDVSGGLALARTWFFAIEALASLITPLGGTLNKLGKDDSTESIGDFSTETSEETHDNNQRVFVDTGYFTQEHNPGYHLALQNTGFLTPKHPQSSEFNLFVGFTVEYVYLLQEYSKCLEYLRSTSYQQVSVTRTAKLMSLVHNAYGAVVAPFVNLKTLIIPEHSPAHPSFPKLDPRKLELQESAYGVYVNGNGQTIYYSWFDLSQQIHCDGLYLRILITPGFFQVPKSHPLVAELVAKIMNALFYVLPKPSKDYEMRSDKILVETANYFISSDLFTAKAFMVQSPYRLVTYFVDDEESFEKLELFFRGLIKLGNGSAMGALTDLLDRREKVRHNKLLGIDCNDVELAHTDIVPFA